jgi:hypothetical protein
MSKIQKTLDDLQPYVIGIRYLEGTPIVDVVFKEGWVLFDVDNIKRIKGNDDLNYHMFYSESSKFGLDELLEHVDKIIKSNQEREKKQELLREKVNQLKEVFKNNSLNKLKKLTFSFLEEEDFMTDLDELEIPIEPITQTEITYIEETATQPTNTKEPTSTIDYVDENGNPITKNEEDLEFEEEEARAKRNLKIFNKSTKPKIELPPKKKMEVVSNNAENEYYECDCGLNEACDKCIDKKEY